MMAPRSGLRPQVAAAPPRNRPATTAPRPGLTPQISAVPRPPHELAGMAGGLGIAALVALGVALSGLPWLALGVVAAAITAAVGVAAAAFGRARGQR